MAVENEQMNNFSHNILLNDILYYYFISVTEELFYICIFMLYIYVGAWQQSTDDRMHRPDLCKQALKRKTPNTHCKLNLLNIAYKYFCVVINAHFRNLK